MKKFNGGQVRKICNLFLWSIKKEKSKVIVKSK
jgi:hypothetical protein